MDNKQDALSKIKILVRDHQLTELDIVPLLQNNASKSTFSLPNFQRILFYLGAIFIFSGIIAYICMFWHKLPAVSRVLITLGSGVACYILTCFLLWQQQYRKFIFPLNLMATFLQTLGLAVYLAELRLTGDPKLAVLSICSIMLLQQGILWWLYLQQAFGFMVFLFATICQITIFELLAARYDLSMLCTGLTVILSCLCLQQIKQKIITEFWYFVGSILFFSGLFSYLSNSYIELFFLVVCCYAVYFSVLVKSRSLLFVTVIAMVSFICYFTHKYFIDYIGWPIALVLLGMMCIAFGMLAFKIQKKMFLK